MQAKIFRDENEAPDGLCRARCDPASLLIKVRCTMVIDGVEHRQEATGNGTDHLHNPVPQNLVMVSTAPTRSTAEYEISLRDQKTLPDIISLHDPQWHCACAKMLDSSRLRL